MIKIVFLGLNLDVQRGESTSLGGSLHLVGQQQISNLKRSKVDSILKIQLVTIFNEYKHYPDKNIFSPQDFPKSATYPVVLFIKRDNFT